MHTVFTKMRAGVTVLALHGSMKQLKRVKTYEEFCRKQYVVLFATDLAARGLGKFIVALSHNLCSLIYLAG